MVNVFAILLANSIPTRCVVNVTSGAGSISLRLDPNNSFYKTKHDQYRVSKTALNMVTACQITEYHPRGWKVSMYCLGWTESNLSPANKVANGAKPTSEGARPIVHIPNGERDDQTGKLLRYDGEFSR